MPDTSSSASGVPRRWRRPNDPYTGTPGAGCGRRPAPPRPAVGAPPAAAHSLRSVALTVLPIRLFGDPVLLTPAEPVTVFDKQLLTLVSYLTAPLSDKHGNGPAVPHHGL